METSVKERLITYLKHIKIGQNKFESLAGISNGYISNLKNAPGADILTKILNAAPDLNRNWLLTGEGSMLINAEEIQAISEHQTYLLPVSARGGTLVDFAASVNRYECEKVVSPIKGIDFAMTVTGDSMAPEYPNGSRIFIKKINERAFIDWGRVYVLDTCNGAVIKQIMPGSSNECVRCVSLNKEYPDFEVQFNDMYGMYRVLLLLTEK